MKTSELQRLTVKELHNQAEKLGIKDSGYRLLSNNGEDANQEVPHLHFHIIGGTAKK